MKKRIRNQGRRCRFESLERRNLLAGDVTARIVQGDLIIKGDQLDNGITIAAGTQANSVVVTSVALGGVATNVNGTANGTVTLAGFMGDLIIKMKGGNDSVSISDLAIAGKLRVIGGRGDDTFNLDGVTVGKSLKIRTGQGDDDVSLVDVDVTEATRVKGSSGDDDVTITDSVFSILNVRFGRGNDALEISGTSASQRTLLKGGRGTNTFTNDTGNTLTNLTQYRFNTTIVDSTPPTLTLGGAATVNEGSAYTLNMSSAGTNASSITQWQINWGDGGAVQTVSGNPTSATHTYADGANNYTISATATFSGGTVTAGNTVAVTINNVTPTLSLSGAASVNEGTAYTLSLMSSDPGADTITQWQINWGDGSAAQTVSGNPASVTHTYTDGANNYTISATATDDDGTFAAGNTVAVTVNNVAPTLSISGAASVNEGAVYTLSLTSSDPGADAITQWQINWGDGSAVQTISGNPSSVTHTFADGANNYTISATATDDDGTFAAGNTVAVTVNNVAPTLSMGGATTVNEGELYTLSLTSSDPGLDTIIQWQISWGDGSAIQTISGNPTSVTHTFPDNGNYTILAAAVDEDGTFLSSNSIALAVNNVTPTLSISGAASVSEGAAYTLSLTSSDPGADTITQWHINWGDGSAVQTVSGNPTGVTHTFADGANNYSISATATDEDGTFAAGNTVAVTVNNVAPTLTIGGAATVNVAAVYMLSLTSSDPGTDTIIQWLINWGDGSPVETVSGNPTSATHTYTDGATNYTITASAVDEDGVFPADNTVAVTVNVPA